MIVVFCDGLCEPVNPGGTACFGWAAYRDGEKLAEGSGVVCSGPEATNNVAEYAAVIKALEWLAERGYVEEPVEELSDSQLCIHQLRGEYAVRSPRVAPLHRRAKKLAGRFRKLRFRWIPREQNDEADALSRRAYERAAPPDPASWRAPRSSPPGRGPSAAAGSQCPPGPAAGSTRSTWPPGRAPARTSRSGASGASTSWRRRCFRTPAGW